MTTVQLPGSFRWLNVTQFLGAFNDNVFKLLLVFQLGALYGEDKQAAIVATASAVFVLPFLLFSHAAGVLADRVSKRTIVVGVKFLETIAMVLGCLAVYCQSVWGLYAVLFLMCTQSALFGPSKYGIIPELVPDDKLSLANSRLVGATYLAIILGTFAPSFLLLNVLDRSYLGLGVFCVGVSLVGIVASLRVRRTPPAGTHKPFTLFFVVAIMRTVVGLRRDRHLLLAVLGSSYYMFVGGFIQQNTFLYGQEYLGLDGEASGYLFSIAALGIGLGALLAGRLSGRNIEFGIVPVGAMGLTVTCILLAVVPPSWTAIGVIVMLIGVSSGLFLVPLYAFIQYRSPAQDRGEILACEGFLGFLGVAISAGVLFVLSQVLGLSAAHGFAVIGLLTGILSLATLMVLPDFFVRFVGLVITRCIYRVGAFGLQNIPREGPALLVSNHVSYVDAVVLASTQQRRIHFIMDRTLYEQSRMNRIFRLMNVIPISPHDTPRELIRSLQAARRSLDAGHLLCIFAEGELTRTGLIQAFRPGLERIVRGTDYPVIPVYLEGLWGSIFSHSGKGLCKGMPRRLPYPVNVLVGEPMPASSSADEVRRAVMGLSLWGYSLRKSPNRTLGQAFVRTARRRARQRAFEDTTGRSVTFGTALVAAVALSGRIDRLAGEEDMVGILLPQSVGGALANVAVSLLGRVAVNLNYTASEAAMRSAIEQCGIRTIVSSRAFLEKLGGVSPPAGTVFLEDILPDLRPREKAAAFIKAYFYPPRALARHGAPGPDDLATVIFSSGSTGDPKGVMLSHHNIVSNIEQFAAVANFSRADRIAGVLPFFHSFGYTVTLWCPALTGFSAHYHPNPLAAERVTRMMGKCRVTALVATPTFLLSYARRGRREDFTSLRLVYAGAEKLRSGIARLCEEKMGIRPLEGYGTTELSPVAAVNIADGEKDGVVQVGTKQGTVGRPLDGVLVQVVDQQSGAVLETGATGILRVKGPNVMAGYLGKPERTGEVLQDGWYDTGDVARIDADGFITILDRVSRYSKIGGEMVPHLAVEDVLVQGLGALDRAVVVTGVQHAEKGEQLVVLHLPEAGPAERLQEIVRASELPNLWKPSPRRYFEVDSLPLLGSGKLDLQAVRQLASELAAPAEGDMA